jgi:F-type H+-transporting ATPase subunit gamma
MAESPMRLRRQIDSAIDLQSVVRAMKAQAAAGIARYEKSAAAVAAYADIVESGLGAALRQTREGGTLRPVRATVPDTARRAIVFGSDQGLVGRFNEAVAALAAQSLAAATGAVGVWAVGDRVHAALDAAGLSPLATLPVPSTVHAVTGLVSDLLARLFPDRDRAPEGSLHEDASLLLYYNRPVPGSGAMYEPVVQRVLPLDEAWQQALMSRRWPGTQPPEVIGDLVCVLRSLVREHLFVSLFRACADSLASENASRLAAMDRADSNIDKLLVGLQGRFHRLRQSGIDEQLSDVTAGFRALADPGSR